MRAFNSVSEPSIKIVGVLCGHVYSIMLRIHCVDTIKLESLQLIFYFMHTILLHSVIEYGEMTFIHVPPIMSFSVTKV